MQTQNSTFQIPIQIVCDKIVYQRLQSIQQNQGANLILYPFKRANSLNYIILDMVRCKQSNSCYQKLQTAQPLIQITLRMYSGQISKQILSYFISKQVLNHQFLNQDFKRVSIISVQKISQLNQLLKQCVIVSLKLPSGFNKQNDCVYHLEGYKFNPKGRITQAWDHLNNGKVIKNVLGNKNQRVINEMKQNFAYSKRQLNIIIGLIKAINSLNSIDNQNSKLVIWQNLTSLGQNFYHSQKLINNPNFVLPILTYQIQILCSVSKGQSSKNQLQTSSIKSSQICYQTLCLDLAQPVVQSQNQIRKKIQQIFQRQNQNQKIQKTKNLLLTSLPTKLINPHMFLKTECKQKFSQYYVKGLYEYYHYGDHNFNDQGWGCAYRSLQTLLSWFRLQQKLNLLFVPTVSQIQNLIDLIDCTSQTKLSNSSNWIGATQVSWVVKKLTGFDCRILHIKDGKDIVQHAQIFRDHLQNIGTPIMYGGDQYAYSIVGINYSWKLGQIMFLILDPHYNGNDKVQKIIQKKGVCWRKPQQMFKKGVFYNFCLPML